MNFGDIMKGLRIKSKLTQKELSDILKVAPSTISMYERGDREPDMEMLEAIADTFNVEINQLYGKELNKLGKPINIIYDDFFPMYYYKNLSAGCFDEIIAPDEAEAVVYVPIKFQRRKKRLVAFEINGTSMNNIIPDHSIVIFEKVEEYKTNDIVVAERNGEFTIKKFIKNDTSVVLVPDSKDKSHLPIAITSNDDLKLYGKVVWYCPPADVFE